MREVAERVEAGVAGDRRGQDLRGEPAHQDDVTVGLGAGDLLRRDQTATAAAVLDHDALLQRGRQRFCNDARPDVGGAAGRK